MISLTSFLTSVFIFVTDARDQREDAVEGAERKRRQAHMHHDGHQGAIYAHWLAQGGQTR